MDQCEDGYMIAREFPGELRVLAVDDDACSLKMLERLLLECGYKVTVTQHAHDALKLLRENKELYDLVISDVNMPEMDGFKLLEIVGLEMDLPVIMLSIDCDVKSVMKGIIHGAVDYLVKPVRLEELKIIWKHVAKKSLKEMKGPNDPRNKLDHARIAQDDHDSRPLKHFKSHEKERDYDDSSDTDDETTAQKKPRVTWTAELHTEFINAVNQLGLDRAVPKKILDIMNIQGLSRENVASHLQKYRRGLKRNGMGLSEHFDTDVGTSGYAGSSDFLTLNSQCPAISFENFGVNGCKTMPATTSTYFPAQQSHNGQAALPSTWFTRPHHQHNDLGRKYAISTESSQVVIGRQHSINSQTKQLVTEIPGFIPNSLVINALTQESNDLSYGFFLPRPNQLNCYTQTCQIPSPSDRTSCLSSAHQLGYAESRQTGTLFNNIHFERFGTDDSSSIELNAMLPSEQKQQQFSACSGVDVEMGALFNIDSLDVHGNINEKLNGRSPFDLTKVPAGNSEEFIASLIDVEHEDDLHAALRQFRS